MRSLVALAILAWAIVATYGERIGWKIHRRVVRVKADDER